jgi:hypothetical protein
MNLKNFFCLLLIITANLAEANSFDFKQERPKSKLKFEPNSNFNNSNINSSKKEAKTNTQKVEKLADKIISTLYLTDSEAKIIHDLCEDRAVKIEKIKLNNDNSQQKIMDLQTVNQDFDRKIKQLVTPNQYQKYEIMRKSGN